MNSIRISDHKGKQHLSYKYNIENGVKVAKWYKDDRGFWQQAKEIIKECTELAKDEYKQLYDCWDVERAEEAIKGLLDLYQKEKEKNKELEEKLKIAKQLYNDACISIATDCIEKDKIKELLENEIIDISGFRCILVEDIENLLEV